MRTLISMLCILSFALTICGCRKPIEGEANKPVPKDVLSKGTEMGKGGPGAPGTEPTKGGPGGPGGVPNAPMGGQGR